MNMRSFFSKEKYNEIYQTKRIVVCSAASSSGVSFVSELIALGLGKNSETTLVEMGKPHFYDSLGFEKHFLGGFIDFYESLRNNEIVEPGKKNYFKNVNWIVRRGNEAFNLSAAELFRLFYLPKTEYVVYDCSSLDQDLAQSFLLEADYPVIVIDPLPSKLISSREYLQKLRISMPKAILIINRMNKGVHISELLHFLGTKEYFSLLSVPQEYIYKAEYNSIPVSCLSELRPSLGKAQDMLSKLF